VNPLVIKRKLQKMAQCLGELEAVRPASLDEYRSDFGRRRAVERLVQLIVDVAVDINTHLIVDRGHAPPADAYSSFIGAAAAGALPPELASALAPSAGERNVIVHEYEDIDDSIVFESLADILLLYRKYIRAILGSLDREGK